MHSMRLGFLLGSALLLTLSLCPMPMLWAAEAAKDEAKKQPQNVGGLLFDVDEGVEIEQGPGGSVYMKSNREFMQDKFTEIERRMAAFEERLAKLEPEPIAPKKKDKEEVRQVLVTQ